jgi:hypothetical protein
MLVGLSHLDVLWSSYTCGSFMAGCILIVVSVVILLFAFGVTITVFRKIFAQVSISAWWPRALCSDVCDQAWHA